MLNSNCVALGMSEANEQGSRHSASHVLECAREYLSRGWRVVPVGFRQKTPLSEGWQNLRLTMEELPAHFGRGRRNLGVLLGEVSGWLVDVDLDCAEAVELAPLILPASLSFGRASRRRGHWLYKAEGAKTLKYKAPLGADRKWTTFVELRASGQTVFPPSVHKSGERVRWAEDCDGLDEPRVVDARSLEAAVLRLAEASLLARHMGLEAGRKSLVHGGRVEAPPDVVRQIRAWRGEPATTRRRPAMRRNLGRTGDLAEAVRKFNEAHPLDLPRSGGQCLVCSHRGCFGHLPNEPQRWACFSASHADAGIPPKDGAGPWTGDALDLEAHAAGLTRVETLRRAGVLS